MTIIKPFDSVHLQLSPIATSAWDGIDKIIVSVQNEEFDEIKVLSCTATWRIEDSTTDYPLTGKDIRWVRLDPFSDGRDSFLLPRRVPPGYILQCHFELTPKDIKASGIDVSKYPIPAGGLRLDFIVLRATVEMENKSGMRVPKTVEYHHRIDKENRSRIIEPIEPKTQNLSLRAKVLQEEMEKEKRSKQQMRDIAQQTLEEKENRSRFLEELFIRSGRNPNQKVSFNKMGEDLGLQKEDLEKIMVYLRGEGLLEFVTFGNIAITHKGIKEVENRASVQNLKREGKAPDFRKVFVVHGHDQEMREGAARTIEKLGLVPIILHEQPNKGRTVIEKFTEYSDVSFAVVLLSPDDVGYSKSEGPEKAKSRTRQNVIFELGFFIGKLGRANVMPLYRPDLNFEFPSDYDGVVYVSYDDSGNWKFKLAAELKAAGYDVDANKLIEQS